MLSERRHHLILLALATFSSACASRGQRGPAPPKVEGKEHTQFTMRYIDLAQGSGAEAAPDKCYYIHYTG